MNEITVENWEAFESKLREVTNTRPGGITGYIFRGQTDASWSLSTTLERSTNQNSISDYYHLIKRISPQIVAFTGQDWETLDYPDISPLLADYDRFSQTLSFGRLPAYTYMMYLRHHGFPSPLLDWSGSPYVAAYFAFRNPCTRNVAIYAFAESPKDMKFRGSNLPSIYGLGPYAKSHRRHFLQQSRYTICAQFQHGGGQTLEWRFMKHDEVFAQREPDQDVLFKFVIPGSERSAVLKRLNEYNLNAFSLFGSEESLMEMLAIQELELR